MAKGGQAQEGKLVPLAFCATTKQWAAPAFLLRKSISHTACTQTPGKAHLLTKNRTQPSANFSVSCGTQNMELNNLGWIGKRTSVSKIRQQNPSPQGEGRREKRA